jgi:L-2-amino-thiazoline-4-carboxylic acid hydrolase
MMGLKLRLLSWWTPQWFLKRGLNELAYSTINGLEELLIKQEIKFDKIVISNILRGNFQERRRTMANLQNQLVKTMLETLGHDKTMKLGREAMFKEGLALGCKFKKMLGVGNSLEDLISAASILYKVLGIKFSLKRKNNGMVMVVNNCVLAEYYNPDTCRVLSAADEGVVQGLNPNLKMEFQERITEGAPCCVAPIYQKENKI